MDYNKLFQVNPKKLIMPKSIPSNVGHDSEYSPAEETKKIIKRNRKSSYANRVFNSSKWTFKENEEFLNFIVLHKEVLICPEKRKDLRIFLQLSRTMNSRTPDQCRSHHQKMIKHHKNLDGIISHLKFRLYGIESYPEEVSVLKEISQNLEEMPSNTKFRSPNTSHELGLIQEQLIVQGNYEEFIDLVLKTEQNFTESGSSGFLPQL